MRDKNISFKGYCYHDPLGCFTLRVRACVRWRDQTELDDGDNERNFKERREKKCILTWAEFDVMLNIVWLSISCFPAWWDANMTQLG